MATKDDLINLAGQFEGVVAAEGQDVQLLVKQGQDELKAQIADLAAQLAAGASPTSGVTLTQEEVDTIAGQLTAALSGIGALATPAPVVDVPVDAPVDAPVDTPVDGSVETPAADPAPEVVA